MKDASTIIDIGPPPEPKPEAISNSSSSKSCSSQIAFQETRGPRVGIQLTLPQANTIFQRHLNCTCTALEYVDQGFNNRTYIATASYGSDYVIRLCGRYWNRWKTEREVATLCFVRLRCQQLDQQLAKIRVPKVYGFCSNRDASGVGHEYILMERVPGVPLEKIWESKSTPKPKLSPVKKNLVLSQIAGILRTMRSPPFTFDKIGSLTLDPATGDTFGIGVNPYTDIQLQDIHIGQHSDTMAGPFENYIEYERAAILAAVEDLKRTPYMASSLDLVPRIEEFIQSQFRTGSNLFHGESMQKPPIALIHGDFEPRNILVDPDTLQITGILDWEFAGALPSHEDWFAGFEAFDAQCDEAWTWPFEVEAPGDLELTENENRELFFRQLQAHGLPTREQVPWLRLYAEMYHFRCNICPWWMQDADVDPVPLEWEQDKVKARARVESILNKYSLIKL